jgi:hypothetical protein
MVIISHRGNLQGPCDSENTVKIFETCFEKGFEVEADVWSIENKYFLGHDKPAEQVDKSFLRNNSVWCHAKNLTALFNMLNDGIHCFWHDQDKFTLTSNNFIWTYPNNNITLKSVIVTNKMPTDICFGVCTDYPIRLRDS